MTAPVLTFEDRLREAYERHFTRHKRQPTRALGFPATVWLLNALDTWEARRVLECGAGWSTTALRLWAAEDPRRRVETTDHKAAWLELARVECAMEGLDETGFTVHEDFARTTPAPFDVVLVDLADTPTRIARLPEFLGWVRPGGILVFDDYHVPAYRQAVTDFMVAHGLPVPSPVLPSTDEWGRYLAVWRRPEV